MYLRSLTEVEDYYKEFKVKIEKLKEDMGKMTAWAILIKEFRWIKLRENEKNSKMINWYICRYLLICRKLISLNLMFFGMFVLYFYDSFTLISN